MPIFFKENKYDKKNPLFLIKENQFLLTLLKINYTGEIID